MEQAPLAIEDLMNELDAQKGADEESDGDSESLEGECEQDLPSHGLLQVRVTVC